MDRVPRHHVMVDFPQYKKREYVVLEEDHIKVEKENARLREITEEQRHRLECLFEGTDGSTPALTRIGRLEHERDQLQGKLNSILLMVTTDQESKASFIARVRLILGEQP